MFRLILAVGIAGLLPVGLYHRLKSQATREKLDRRQEGLFMLITLRVFGVVGWAALILYLIDPSWMAWSAVALPTWARWAGVGLFVLAGLLVIWTFRNLGKNLTDTVVTRKEHTLVTTGPYRWVRHPFYVACLLTFTAIALVAANWFFLLMGAVAFSLLFRRTRIEEEKLLERFGDDYRQYMNSTGRHWPKRRAEN